MSEFDRLVPDRLALLTRLGQGVAVAVTLAVLDGSPTFAVGSAALFVAFTLGLDASAAVVGDYADNAALGLLTLAFTGYLAVEGWLPALAVGVPVGGWLLFDGVQHLRHGETRETVAHPYRHDGGPVTGLLRALGARLLEPFRL